MSTFLYRSIPNIFLSPAECLLTLAADLGITGLAGGVLGGVRGGVLSPGGTPTSSERWMCIFLGIFASDEWCTSDRSEITSVVSSVLNWYTGNEVTMKSDLRDGGIRGSGIWAVGSRYHHKQKRSFLCLIRSLLRTLLKSSSIFTGLSFPIVRHLLELSKHLRIWVI